MEKIVDAYFQFSIEQADKNKFQNDFILNFPNRPDPTRLRYAPIFDVIQTAINRFEANQSEPDFIRVRSDARLFLLLNFDQMVFRPLTAARNLNNISGSISEDVTNILETARIATKEKRESEISGHEVLNACSRLWGSLKTLAKDSW